MARRVTRGKAHRCGGVVLGLSLFSGLAGWPAGAALAQLSPIENPVYLDDSTAARVTLERLDELIARGSEGEAVRALQQLLDEEGERLLPSNGDEALYVTVRRRVHEALLARPDLLERYRETEEATGAALLEDGRHASVERSRLLTTSGLEGALRVAQEHLEGARFDAARRTLEQLDHHPDFEGDIVGEAAELAALVSRYAGDNASRRLATRWADRAGIDKNPGPTIDEPASGRINIVEPIYGLGGWTGQPSRVDSVLADPVESVQLTLGDDSDGVGRGGLPAAAWTMPSIAGDTLYLNDGETVSAWDRFTMRPLWRVRTVDDPDAPISDDVLRSRRDSLGRNLEDPTGVTVHADLVLAVTGRANAGERRGDPRVHAFDRATGQRLWSVNPQGLDSSLDGGSIRGPVLVSDGVAVVAVRKMLRRRRLVSVLLVGLELGTGELRWVRQVASTGSLPFQQFSPLPVGLAESDGVVYLTDVLGVAGAVEAATGRTVWVTRMASNPFLPSNARAVWMASNPVLDGDSLVLISPDGLWITRLDAGTGELLGRRPASDFGEPGYLVRAGEWLCAVGPRSVSVVSLAGMEVDDVRRSAQLPDPGIRGRAVPAGDTLALPVADGLLLIDPASPRGGADMSREVVPLARTGNALVLDGQAVVVDDSAAHNFLSWEVASALLEARLDANPADPGPALIYTELAYRSGEVGRLVEITDRAIAAVEGLSGTKRHEAGDRLFEALSVMVTSGGDLGGGRDHSARGWGGAVFGAPGGAGRGPIEDTSIVRALLARMERLSRTPSQRVVTVLAQAELSALEGDAVAALERYQRVLSEPSLRVAEWRGGPLVVRAGAEALRRLERLLEREGLAAYAIFDGAALAETEAIAPGDVANIRAVATRYPASGVAVSMWLRAGRLALDQGDINDALRDLREGLGVIERRRRAGGEPAGEGVEGELAGLLIATLVERDRVGAAGRVLERARRLGITPTLNGRPSSYEGLGEGGLARPPVLGRTLSDAGVTLLSGEPVVPVVRTRRADPGRALLLSPVTGELILADRRDGELRERWRRPMGRTTPLVVRSDADSVVVLRPRVSPGSGGWLEGLDVETGETLWRSLSFDDSARGRGVPRGARVEIGGGSQVSATQLLVAVEDTTVVLLERWGRAVAFDLTRGLVLWADELGVRSVSDAAIVDGVLVVGGESDTGDGLGSRPSLVSLDARTGESMQRIDGLTSEVRWIRGAVEARGGALGGGLGTGLGSGGGVVVGLRNSVIGLDVESGQPRWNLSDEVVRNSRDAWVAGSGVTVMTEQGGLWLIGLATGRLSQDPIDLRSRVQADSDRRVYWAEGRTIVSTDRGVVAYNERGEVVGLDPLDGAKRSRPGVLGTAPDGRAVVAMVTTEGDRRDDGASVMTLRLLEATTGRVVDQREIAIPPELSTRVVGLHAIDGAVLVGFGSATLVVPVED